jgi:hypothetical protein
MRGEERPLDRPDRRVKPHGEVALASGAQAPDSAPTL